MTFDVYGERRNSCLLLELWPKLKFRLNRYFEDRPLNHVPIDRSSNNYTHFRIVPSFMTSWHSLPPEIHRLILQQFCISIANDFKSLAQENLLASAYDRYFTSVNGRTWPNTPECLSSFVSALRTCQQFYNELRDAINLDGESPIEHLQNIQYENVSNVIRYLDYDFSDDEIGVVFFYMACGCFWRNSKVLDDNHLLGQVMQWIPILSRFMLIPHLKHWLWPRRVPFHHANSIFALRIDQDEDDPVKLCLVGGRFKVCKSGIRVHSIISPVSGIINGNAKEMDPILFNDIKDSLPNSWWLFHHGHDDPDEPEEEWSLVNYEKRKMYSRTFDEYACSHSWRDVWDVADLMEESSGYSTE